MICPECNSKFTFKERFKLINLSNDKITCDNCGSVFIKDSSFNILDFIIGLALSIATIVGLILLINSIYYNLYLSNIVAIISGRAVNDIYLYLIQNFRSYKKYIEQK